MTSLRTRLLTNPLLTELLLMLLLRHTLPLDLYGRPWHQGEADRGLKNGVFAPSMLLHLGGAQCWRLNMATHSAAAPGKR